MPGGVIDRTDVEDALRNAVRPAISSAAVMFCDTARFTDHVCPESLEAATGVIHHFLMSLPPARFMPSKLDAEVRGSAQGKRAPHPGILKAASLLCDGASSTGAPCHEHQVIASVLIHRFLVELPDVWLTPSQLDHAIRIHSGQA